MAATETTLTQEFQILMMAIAVEFPPKEVPRQYQYSARAGVGPWDGLIVEAYLDALRERRDNFDWAQTNRMQGWQLTCPGYEGWSDGEQHSKEDSASLKDGTIIYLREGWGQYSCRHAHCSTGAAHGKKTFGQWLDHVDPNRSILRKVFEERGLTYSFGLEVEVPDLTAWNTSAVVVENDEVIEDEEEPVVVPPVPFPMEVMSETEIGRIAMTLDSPPAWAFYAALIGFASQGTVYLGDMQTNMFGVFVAPVGRGKSRTARRAIGKFGKPGTLLFDNPDHVIDDDISSDNALLKYLGAKPTDKLTPEDKVALPRLLFQDEGTAMMTKGDIAGNVIFQPLNKLFSDMTCGKKVGEKTLRCYVILSAVLCVTASGPAEFAMKMGRGTIDGFYDRSLIVTGPAAWEFEDGWVAESCRLRPLVAVLATASALQLKKAWQKGHPESPRAGELALRIAINLTAAEAAAGKLPRETIACPEDLVEAAYIPDRIMELALLLMDHQLHLKTIWTPGKADNNPVAQCAQAIRLGLLEYPGSTWMELCDRLHLYHQHGPSVLKVVKRDMQEMLLIRIVEKATKGRPRQVVEWLGGEEA